jgi:hypothetical protein
MKKESIELEKDVKNNRNELVKILLYSHIKVKDALKVLDKNKRKLHNISSLAKAVNKYLTILISNCLI